MFIELYLIYISKYLDHPSASTCHYAHDQSSPTFALALLWARWKATSIHFCMLSHETLSFSFSLSLSSPYLSLSIFSLFLCPSVYLFLFFIFLSSQRDEDVGRSRNAPASSLSCKSKKSNRSFTNTDKKLLSLPIESEIRKRDTRA